MMSLPRILLVAVSLLMLGSPAGLAADWREFRGPAGLGVAADQRIRETWSETEGISWRADLPGRSASSPIVVGDLVVTTASSGARQNQLHVIALDRETGKRRWERTFWATGRTLCHPTSAVAANTPASDGERIVALFSSCDLFCLDLEGRLLWQRNLAVEHPRAGNDVGMGSSPRIVDDMVVVQIDCQGDAFATAIDLASGDDRWSVARDRIASWASPLVVETPAGQGVLLQNPNGLEARGLTDGELLWELSADCRGIPMTAATGGMLFVPADGITAVAAGRREPAWRAAQLSPGIASPVAWDDLVAVLNRGGVLAVGNAADGTIRGRVRLAGSFWGSPLVAGDRLVAVNTEGTTFLVDTAAKPAIVAENSLPGTFTATPAVADGSLYLRSETALWKVSPPE
jgi:outer membrane protein assembly factor BamB